MPSKAKKVKNDCNKLTGSLIIVAAVELVFFVLLAQHLYPNYSLSNNYISDLGVGSTAIIFNTAIQSFGILILLASYLMFRYGGHRYAAIGFAIAALGGIGVGTFPETTGNPHIISAFIVFTMVSVLALGFSRIFKAPLSYYSALAGILGLFVLALFIFNMITGAHLTFGLGKGGVEEILFYDELIWALIVGISFITKRI